MTRANLPALGYVYVAFALPALFLGGVDEGHERLSSALLTVAIFAYLWFLASLRARLVRYDPDGLFASVVVLGGAAYVPLQLIAVLQGSELLAAPSSACAATVVMGSSLAAWRARKIPRWFGQAGIAGAVAILAVGLAEWTVTRDSVFASSLGFMIWVLVTATYLLRR